MRKGERTQQAIIDLAMDVFNRKGYAGTSMGDLMDVTGLSKGAIYNHFESKDDIALQAYDRANDLIVNVWAEALRHAPKHAIHRLVALLEVYRNYLDEPVLASGCPILNTAVEADDTHPGLRARAAASMDNWQAFLHREFERGIEYGQVRPDADIPMLSTMIITVLEGGIMMSKLYGDSMYVNHVVDFLKNYLFEQVQLNPLEA